MVSTHGAAWVPSKVTSEESASREVRVTTSVKGSHLLESRVATRVEGSHLQEVRLSVSVGGSHLLEVRVATRVEGTYERGGFLPTVGQGVASDKFSVSTYRR